VAHLHPNRPLAPTPNPHTSPEALARWTHADLAGMNLVALASEKRALDRIIADAAPRVSLWHIEQRYRVEQMLAGGAP